VVGWCGGELQLLGETAKNVCTIGGVGTDKRTRVSWADPKAPWNV